MTQETEVSALPSVPDPAPAAPEKEPFTAPQDAAPEQAESPEVEEKLWLHEVESEDAAWDHEKFAPRREAIVSEALAQGRIEAQQEATSLFSEGRESFDTMTQQLRSLLGRFNKAADDGTIDTSGAQDLLTNNREAFAAMNKVVDEQYQNQHRGAAFTYFLTELGQEVGDTSLASDFEKRLPFAVRGMDKKFIPDLRKRITGKDGDDRYNDGYKKGMKTGKTAQAEQTKAQQDKGGGPSLVPGQMGGGRSDNEILRDPTTPVEKLIEIRTRQKAGG